MALLPYALSWRGIADKDGAGRGEDGVESDT